MSRLILHTLIGLALFLCVSGQIVTTFNISTSSYDGTTAQETLTTNGTAASTSVSIVLGNYVEKSGQVAWAVQYTTVNYSSLNTSLQMAISNLNFSSSTVEQIYQSLSLSLYVIPDPSRTPYAVYMGLVEGLLFSCSEGSTIAVSYFPSPPYASDITCSLESGNVNASFRVGSQQIQDITVTSSSAITAAQQQFILTIGFIRMQSANTAAYTQSMVASAFSSRTNLNQKWAGAFYFLFVFTMLLVMLMAVTLQTWLWMGPNRFNHSSPRMQRCFFAFWFSVLLIILIAISFPVGIVAWAIIGIIYGCYAVALSISYCIIRCCERRNSKKRSESSPNAYGQRAEDDPSRPAISSKVTLAFAGEDPEAPTGYRNEPKEWRWFDCQCGLNSLPDSMGAGQAKLLLIFFVLFLVAFGLGVLLFFFAWTVPDYYVIDRSSQTAVVEYIPQTIAKGVSVVYAYPGVAVSVNINPFFVWASSVCGTQYSSYLSTDDERYQSIYVSFIQKYGIDMNIFIPSNYLDYSSVNDWFIRQMNFSYRPITKANVSSVAVMPADARIVAFENVPPDQAVWIKDSPFTIPHLLGYGSTVTDVSDWTSGSLIISRLAPQDYHRFHSPVTGAVIDQYSISGTLQSVDADAMTAKDGAIFNKRTVTVFNTTDFGRVAFVAIGAVCVGSINMVVSPGNSVQKADYIGNFQFGGSTVVTVFQSGTIRFDDDLLLSSSQGAEQYVLVGTQLGLAIS